jgi:dienelactone hydrolase
VKILGFQTAVLFLIIPVLFAAAVFPEEPQYDPLSATAENDIRWADLTVADAAREREIPVRIYIPESVSPAPIVLFSHGLGGSREGSAYLGKHWAARGYWAVFLQHPGSDTSTWSGEPPSRRLQSMRDAADAENFMLRVRDVSAVLDQLERWNRQDGHLLKDKLDLAHIGMSGHSFGAVTTQAVSGQKFGRGRLVSADARIDAAVIMSPSSPNTGSPENAFGEVAIPWLLMTGTKDVSIIGNADMKSRLAVFPALPAGRKYELLLDGAEHSAFTERALPGDSGTRNPNHHRAILALSTAFWDAYLRDDEKAAKWLDGDGPKSVLESGDKWQKK